MTFRQFALRGYLNLLCAALIGGVAVLVAVEGYWVSFAVEMLLVGFNLGWFAHLRSNP